MASIDITPPHPTNPDAPAQRLLRLAQAAASQPFQKQRLQSMLGVLRERLAAVRNGDPVPSVGALLDAFPGGENGYWSAWLDHEQVAEAVPAAQLMALHAVSEIFDNVIASNLTTHPALVVSTAPALEEARRVQDELARLIAGHHATPEALRSRLLWLAGHPQYSPLVCSGLREWLAVSAAESSPAEASPPEPPPEPSPESSPSPRIWLQRLRDGYAREVLRKEGLAPDPEPAPGELWTLTDKQIASVGGLWQLAGKHAPGLPDPANRASEETEHRELRAALKRVTGS